MPKFCTSCGSPVEENVKFCAKCGASLVAPSPPAPAAEATAGAPVATAPAAATAAPAAARVATAPARKGSPVLKIILIVVALFVVLGLLGAAAGIYVVYKAKQKVTSMVETAKTATQQMGTPEVHLEKGGEGSEAAASATLDVPPYPGSTPTEAGGGMNLGGLGGISGQEYVTADSVDKVLAFYKEKLGSKITVQQAEGSATFTLTTDNGVTTVTITRDEEAGKTKINIARLGK